ncbi:MAG TPA: universal stress protein [Gemmatimonadales bacterium]|nr:universal stress protein [Gemmatimonadales bacterium]
MSLRHIVVATDESDAGRQAVRTGLDLAGRAGAKLTVMRVVSLPATPLIGAMAGGVENAELDAAGTALERLQRWLSADVLPAGSDLSVALGIAFGVPGIEICRFAEQRDADLLVLGRKQRSPLARLLLGDTADAVIRRSRVPCLFVQPGSRPIREILVALDGSERGMRVLAGARTVADSVRARSRVVTVEEEEPTEAFAPAPPRARSLELERKVEGSAIGIRRGAVVKEILTEVAERAPDVLAIGYHRGGPPGIIEGSSTARQLTHTAPVSVLAIPL